MYSRIRSAVCSGIEGREVFVETDISRGLPAIGMVGLASTMVMESRERIKGAVINSGFDFPRGRITVNLIPASLRKNSSCLDLPIALGILSSAGELFRPVSKEWGIIGELSLDGRVLGVDGALPMILHMLDAGIRGIIVPASNIREAVLTGGNIFVVNDLRECVELVSSAPDEAGSEKRADHVFREVKGGLTEESKNYETAPDKDFKDIAGQERAKRAVVIAAAGRHGLLMVGSPGCGKTMIAGRIPGVMPAMTEREMLETAIVRSVAGRSGEGLDNIGVRPFRSPHHTIGRAGLIGGGRYPVPGEITLAHNGVLFLDEVCEFNQDTIESLRIPIEEKKITHFRNGEAYTFPCNFQIVMAANPCPCGFFGDRDKECTCSQAEIDRYRRRLSGPMMDRIDMKITMEKVAYDELSERKPGMTSEEMRMQVTQARIFAKENGRDSFNSELANRELEVFCGLGTGEKRFMNRAYDALSMSPRAYSRTLKVARTIADLDSSLKIKERHLAEALSYRIQE